MQASKLPIEVCERVIDCLAISVHNPTPRDCVSAVQSIPTLYACALVCRDWTYRSQHHLFRQVRLHTTHQAYAFLDVVTCHPHTAKLVQLLEISPRCPPSTSHPPKPASSPQSESGNPAHPSTPVSSESNIPLRDQAQNKAEKISIPPCYYNWIYKLLIRLPPLLNNLSTLTLISLPTLHPRFIRLVSCFKTVKALGLCRLEAQSLSEIIQLVNRLPQLTFLEIANVVWDRPARFFPSHQLRLEHFICNLSSDGLRVDVLDWLGSLQHLSGLRSLRMPFLISDTNKLCHILHQCTRSLRYLFLALHDEDILESLSLSSHSKLEHLSILITSHFPNHAALFSSCVSQLLSPSLVCLHIGYLEILDPEPLAAQSSWKDVDDALGNPKFNQLTYFVMQLRLKHEETLDREALQATFKKIFPKSYERGILWVTKRMDDSSRRVFHICEYDEHDFNITQFENSYLRP